MREKLDNISQNVQWSKNLKTKEYGEGIRVHVKEKQRSEKYENVKRGGIAANV